MIAEYKEFTLVLFLQEIIALIVDLAGKSVLQFSSKARCILTVLEIVNKVRIILHSYSMLAIDDKEE